MKAIFFIFFSFISIGAYASNEYTDGKLSSEKPDQGWFWYEQDPDEVEPKKTKVKDNPVSSESKSQEKKPISVAWLRENLPKLHEKAIDEPTRINIQAYMYAQRAMMDKAQRHSEAARLVVLTDPLLDENNRVPMTGAAKNAFLDKEYLAKKESLKYLSKNVGGLFMFFDSKCDFCRQQARVVKMLQKDYGFYVKFISIDGKGLPEIQDFEVDKGQAKKFEVTIFPTTIFVAPPNNYLVVSQGMLAADQLADRILLAATDRKLLPKEMAVNSSPWNRGVLTPEDLADGATDNIEDFVKNVQEKLKKRY